MSGNQSGKQHEPKLHQSDMKTHSADPPSEKPKGGSVNDEPTRSGVAKTPGSLGSRCA